MASCDADLDATKTPVTTISGSVFSAIYVAEPNEAIDIVFVADDDYGDLSMVSDRQDFLDDVEPMIEEGFWKNQVFAFNVFRVNYWFMNDTGNVQAGTGICPAVTWPSNINDAAFAEVIVMLHDQPLRDCAWGNRVTTRVGGYSIVVHEAGHAAFGLPDEYCCDGGYWNVPPILYSSQNACTSDAANSAWRNCQSFNATSGSIATWWRSEDTHCDTMACGRATVLEFGRADWVKIEAVLSGLANPAVITPNTFGPDEWP